MAATKQKAKRAEKIEAEFHDDGAVPVIPVNKDATITEMYVAAHGAFTASDLQKFTVPEKGVPMRQVVAELAAIDRQQRKRRQRKTKHGGPR